MQTESDHGVKAIWELHLNTELEHLRIVTELMRQYDGRDPAELLPTEDSSIDQGCCGRRLGRGR